MLEAAIVEADVPQSPAELLVRVGRTRIGLDGRAEQPDRFVKPPLLFVELTEVHQRVGVIRLTAKDGLIVGGGGGGITGRLHRRGEARLRVGVVRGNSHRRAKRLRRRLDPRQVEIDVAEVQVRMDKFG